MSKHRHIPRKAGWRLDDDGTTILVQRLERQVLIPGTRKAAPHPLRDRLRAAMDGKPTTKASA